MADENSRESKQGRGVDDTFRQEKMVLDLGNLHRELELLAPIDGGGHNFPINDRVDVRTDRVVSIEGDLGLSHYFGLTETGELTSSGTRQLGIRVSRGASGGVGNSRSNGDGTTLG